MKILKYNISTSTYNTTQCEILVGLNFGEFSPDKHLEDKNLMN